MTTLRGVWKQHLRPRAVVGYGVKIFLPSPPNYVTRSPGSGSGRTKKFEFFHWLTENECAAQMRIKKLYAVHFTSGPVRLEVDGGNGGTFVDCSEFAGALYEKNAKQMVTIPDRSEGIVKVST